jgi:hypothetical protein
MKRLICLALVALASLHGECSYGDELAPAEPTKESLREEDRVGARSDEYSRVFDRAITCLIQRDSGCFRGLLSQFTISQETRGPGAVDLIIQDRYIPYFSDFERLTDRVGTVPSYDGVGNTGFAICRSFITSDKKEKFFVLYVVKEKDTYRVGNLLLDTKMEQIVKAKSSQQK